MRLPFFHVLLPRPGRSLAPVLAGGSCAALILVLLAGFVPGMHGSELRLAWHPKNPTAVEVSQQGTWPLDTSVWMVRRPFEHAAATQPFTLYPEQDVDPQALVDVHADGVSILTAEGRRLLSPQREPVDLLQHLSRETRGLPTGLNLDFTAVVDGTAMPWCVPAPGQSWNAPNLREAWLRRRVMPYSDVVNIWVQRFGLNRDLVYSIMYVESGFNPIAVSNRGAQGLMQVVPATAGTEVHSYLFDTVSPPSRAELLNPAVNIQYGATYLHLLSKRHMQGINDPLTREYCVIAAYNTGPGLVLNLFGKNREEAFNALNSYTPAQVYDLLQQRLPSEEARHYLRKVLSLKNGMHMAAAQAQ